MDDDVGFEVISGEDFWNLGDEALVFGADEIQVVLPVGKLGFERLIVDHVVDRGSGGHFLAGEEAGAGAHCSGVEDGRQTGPDAGGAEGEGLWEEVLRDFPGLGRMLTVVGKEGRHAVMENERLEAQGCWMDDGVGGAAERAGEPAGVREEIGVGKAAGGVEEKGEGWLDGGWRRVGQHVSFLICWRRKGP